MKPPIFNGVNRLLNGVALKGLENAYQGALAIKTIEDKHFHGKEISFYSDKGKTVADYFTTQLNKQLFKVRLGLTQFKVSSYISKPSYRHHPPETDGVKVEVYNPLDYYNSTELEPAILERLGFIESVVGKYRDRDDDYLMEANTISQQVADKTNTGTNNNVPVNQLSRDANDILMAKTKLERDKANESGSIFGVVSQIRKQFSPEYDQEIVKELRKLRRQERTSLRWFALVLIVPLMVQWVARNTFLEHYFNKRAEASPIVSFQHDELSERYLTELGYFQQALEVGQILGKITPEEKQEKLIDKTKELLIEFKQDKLIGLKNLYADLISLATFLIMVYVARSKLVFLRSWINRTFISLNDVTKVFVFILMTDLFVGFHSVEGWEVILRGLAEHFGLPESQTFNYTFIATVPVILDSCFKLWVFNYLTRSSPSAVAILEKMNQ